MTSYYSTMLKFSEKKEKPILSQLFLKARFMQSTWFYTLVAKGLSDEDIYSVYIMEAAGSIGSIMSIIQNKVR